MRRHTHAAAVCIRYLLTSALLLLVLSSCSRPVTRTVEIRGMQFEPRHIDAHVGDTIVWKNSDMVPHTATASKELDTGELKMGEQGRWVVRKAGVIDYLCSYHTTMRGSIAVR
jgi:plastocyanin